MTASIPSFESWAAYCLEQAYADFSAYSDATGADFDAIDARETKFLCLKPPVIAEYLARLFESPAFIAESYTDDQIADATWFLFGCGSGFIHEVRYEAVPPELQIRCIRSVATMYTDCFDRVCGRRSAEPDTDLRESSALDCAVYMIWDMDQLEGAVMFPDTGPHLVEPGIEVLQTVLDRCRTSACLISALHGIGGIYKIHSGSGDKAIADRMQQMVDRFLRKRKPPVWIRDYARAAREGAVV